MKKVILLAVVAVFVGAGVASAYDLNCSVETDKEVYAPGETVYWTMYAWTCTDCPGISLLALNLLEDRNEVLNAADIVTYEPYPSVFISELVGSDYGLADGFTLESEGVPEPAGGLLADIVVRQADGARTYGAGATGSPIVFAQGNLPAGALGMHNLSITINGANNWTGTYEDQGPAEPMTAGQLSGDDYEVVPEPATMGLLLLGALALIRRRR